MDMLAYNKISKMGASQINRDKPAIAVIGSGVVGMATGTGFHKHGFDITFVDVNEAVVSKLVSNGYKSSTVPALDPKNIDIFFISVPTYISDDENGLAYLRTTAENLGVWLSKKADYSLIVIRSTVTPGTTEEMVIPIIEEISGKKAGVDFGVCVNPEYLREKSSASDFEKPWIVTIGALDQKSGDVLEEIYGWADCPIFRISIKEAEIQKILHNVYNAAKISFFNEMRLACREIGGIDCEKVFMLISKSAEAMWNPEYGIKDYGPFGGACLPKDTRALYQFAKQNLSTPMPMLQATLDINDCLSKNVVNRDTLNDKKE